MRLLVPLEEQGIEKKLQYLVQLVFPSDENIKALTKHSIQFKFSTLWIVQLRSSQGSEPSHPFVAAKLNIVTCAIPSAIAGNGRLRMNFSGFVTRLIGANNISALSLLSVCHSGPTIRYTSRLSRLCMPEITCHSVSHIISRFLSSWWDGLVKSGGSGSGSGGWLYKLKETRSERIVFKRCGRSVNGSESSVRVS